MQLVLSAAKHVTFGKRRKTCSWCQAGKNLELGAQTKLVEVSILTLIG